MSGLAVVLGVDGRYESEIRWLPGFALAVGRVKLVKELEAP